MSRLIDNEASFSSTRGKAAVNPKLLTLLAILRRIKRSQPINFYQLAKMRDGAYLTVYRYFKFCVQHGLLDMAEYDEARGSKKYVLSEKGRTLLRIFEEAEP